MIPSPRPLSPRLPHHVTATDLSSSPLSPVSDWFPPPAQRDTCVGSSIAEAQEAIASMDPETAFLLTLSLITNVFRVTRKALLAPTRQQAHVALARQVAMYLLHVCGGVTLRETGRCFGRDRTTVAHACARVEDRRDDPLFDLALDHLERALRGLFSFCGRGQG